MNRRLAAIVASAALVAGAVVVTLTTQDGTESAVALSRKQTVAAIIAVAPFMPVTTIGQCRDVEIALLADEAPDAADRVGQWIWRYCPDEGSATNATLPERKCRQAARDLCLGAVDAGEDSTRTREERVCLDRVHSECEQVASRAGHVVWASEEYPKPADAPELSRYNRREQAALLCACPDSHDAGPCRRWDDGADASRPMAPGDLAQPGRWNGRGCVASPCSESTLTRRHAGSEYPEACRP
jgi:hypothetical protein